MACKMSGFKSYRPLVGSIETQGSSTTDMYFSLNYFLKILQKLGGRLEIRLSVYIYVLKYDQKSYRLRLVKLKGRHRVIR